jgi:hypothetical protein
VEAGAGEGVDMIGAQLTKTTTNNTKDGKLYKNMDKT